MTVLWRWFDSTARRDPPAHLQFKVRAVGSAEEPLVVRAAEILGGGAADWTPDPRHPETFRPPDRLGVCLTLERSLPNGSLDAKLDFLPPGAELPADLSVAAANRSLAGPALPSPVGPTTAAARGFLRELDFSGVLLSSVLERTSAGVTSRTRDTKGVADLFLAPVLKLRRLSYESGKNWFTYFTPIALEAHASTQPILKDTLSQNRIVMGPEYEFRYYLNNRNHAPSDNVLRLTLMFKNASDRDFKLNEPKFVAEFRPVWGKANREILDPRFIRGVPGVRLTRGEKIGRKLSPFFGFEKGSSYSRGVPASALVSIGPFTRGYLGIDAGVDFNRMIAFSTTQTLYIRGERDNDLVHYMKSSVQWTFLAPNPQFASSVFLSFEKGRLPPFRSTVNAVNLGIRVQSSKWGLVR